MKIEYYGHSSFRFESREGSVVTDPFGDIGFPMPAVRADVVTVSHDHYDHNNLEAVDCKRVLRETGSYSFRGIGFEAIENFHDDVQGRKRGKNLVFFYSIEGIILCHMGDTGEPCSPGLLQRLKKADVLLLPVGGNYTLDYREAIQFVENLHPSFVIPMHFKTPDSNLDISPPDEFLAHFPSVVRVGNKFDLCKDDLGGETKIIYMER